MSRVQWLGCCVFLLLVSGLQAQENPVKCESNDGNRKYCGEFRGSDVRLERQISGSACIEGRSWGVDRRGLWVDHGCRAYFVVNDYRDGGYGRGDRDRDRDRDGWWDRDDNAPWPPRGDWQGGNWERGGACFYKDRNFQGSYFCMRRGEARDSLGGYGDAISSIRVFGGVRVAVFDDQDFRGASQTFRDDIADLHNRQVWQKSGHTWNDRISSLQVR